MHSSRMHTARLLTVSPSMHYAGGRLVPGGYALEGVSALRGAWSQGGLLWRGCLLGGVPGSRGVPGPRGSALGGGWRGAWSRGWVGVVSQHALRQTPHREFLTQATENITLPQTSFAGGN